MFPFTLSDLPLILWYIGVLVFFEGLLSADNALVLAAMVRHLPKDEQKRVLRYGIWGAIGFRFVGVLLSAILFKFWIFQFFGGAYLIYLTIDHFVRSKHEDPASTAELRSGGIWRTVVSVTLADVAFSIDSILAAVAMAKDFPDRFGDNGKYFIVYVGGVLGIITMRFVVRYFVLLLDRFPGLAEGAYILVAWIGIKLVLSSLDTAEWIASRMPESVFWTGMVVIAIASMLVKPRSISENPGHEHNNLELYDREFENDQTRNNRTRAPLVNGLSDSHPSGDFQACTPASDETTPETSP